MNSISRILITFGIILIAAGVLFQFAPKVPWLGRLPGDIYIRKGSFALYFPLATSIIISIIISMILYFLGRR